MNFIFQVFYSRVIVQPTSKTHYITGNNNFVIILLIVGELKEGGVAKWLEKEEIVQLTYVSCDNTFSYFLKT